MSIFSLSSTFILLPYPFKLTSYVIDTLYSAAVYEIKYIFLVCKSRCAV